MEGGRAEENKKRKSQHGEKESVRAKAQENKEKYFALRGESVIILKCALRRGLADTG